MHKRVIRESGADYVKESRVGARKMPRRKAYTVPKAYNPDEYRKARRRDIKWAFESLETAPRGTYVYTDESGTRHVRNNSDYRDNDTTATKAAALPRVRIATGRAYTAAEMREMKRDECRAVWTYGGGNAYTAAEIREMKRNDCIRVFTAAKAAAPHIDKVVKATAATIEKRAAKAAPKATAKTAPKATAKAAAIRAEITAMKAEITAMKAARALTESATK